MRRFKFKRRNTFHVIEIREKCIGVIYDKQFCKLKLRRKINIIVDFYGRKNEVIKMYCHAGIVIGITSSPWIPGTVFFLFHLSNLPLE